MKAYYTIMGLVISKPFNYLNTIRNAVELLAASRFVVNQSMKVDFKCMPIRHLVEGQVREEQITKAKTDAPRHN